MKYSYLKPISMLTFSEMKEFVIEHYFDLLSKSNSRKQITFLEKQILSLLK